MYDKIQCVNRFVIGQLVLQEPVLSLVRRELRKMSEGVFVDESEIENILRGGVFKRDIIDEEQPEVQSAIQRVNKFYRHAAKKVMAKKENVANTDVSAVEVKEQVKVSVTEQLLAEAEAIKSVPDPAPQAVVAQ